MSIFTPPGDASLTMRAAEVKTQEINSEKIQSIIDRMFQIASGKRSDQRTMVGLAAPQIGIGKRIILVDTGFDTKKCTPGHFVVFINPEILWYSGEIAYGHEGCFSVDSHIVGIVPRSVAIKIKAFDRQGKEIFKDYSNYTARIFQHEVDHLNGIRFPDRVGSAGKLHWVEKSRNADYQKNWEKWDCPCPWDVWLAMKEGKPFTPPS